VRQGFLRGQMNARMALTERVYALEWGVPGTVGAARALTDPYVTGADDG
jgi:hypothetical protein